MMTTGDRTHETARRIGACLEQLRDTNVGLKVRTADGGVTALRASIADGLWQARAACPRPLSPIRTVHHLACTGGTLFAKCLSALPNVRLLSEVDPLSDLVFDAERPAFAPTDLVTLLKQTPGGRDPALIAELFRAQIELLHRNASRAGRHLVIRDHAHSHFCMGASVPVRPRLIDLLPVGVPVRSLITVRHPVDSFTSLMQNGWVLFEPASFETYCERYHAFLDAYRGIPMVRYEEFIMDPVPVMRQIATVLELRPADEFVDLFSVFKVTGDSGRSGDLIGPRERHAAAAELERCFRGVTVYQDLLSRLGYEPESDE